MFQSITTVVVAVAGQQAENIATCTKRDHAHIQVQSGPAWVTCIDVNAVASHAYAWGTARDEARQYLPHTADLAPERPQLVASAILRHVGFAEPQVYRSITEDDRPYLEVIVGSLRTRVFDQAAAESLAQTWARALTMAPPIWATNPPIIDTTATGHLMGRRGHAPIARQGLPPQP